MDAFALVRDSTKSSAEEKDMECRCGATAANKNVWEGVEPPNFLLPMNAAAAEGKTLSSAKDGECDVSGYVFTGKGMQRKRRTPGDE